MSSPRRASQEKGSVNEIIYLRNKIMPTFLQANSSFIKGADFFLTLSVVFCEMHCLVNHCTTELSITTLSCVLWPQHALMSV